MKTTVKKDVSEFIKSSIDALTQFRGYAIEFGHNIVSACNNLGVYEGDISEVMPYSGGGGYLFLFMKLNNSQILIFNYVEDCILITKDKWSLNQSFLDVFESEFWLDWEETKLSNPSPEFITSNLLSK